jgi:dTDP-4-amino-4,6-dideoxygalactose transaminase
VATLAAIEAAGARPVLVDTHPISHQLDPERIEAAITPATKAILPVHLYGHLADLDAILAVADRHGLAVVEDACQAHGARDASGRRAGSRGTAAAFSFYPSKNLGAYGDGGMVVTDDPELDRRLRLLRNLGSAVKYRHDTLGFNRRLDTLQAAILSVKLDHLDDANADRRRVAAHYDAAFDQLPLTTPRPLPGSEPVHHLYVLQTPDRDGLQAELHTARIATGIHYPVPIHLQPAYAWLGHRRGELPVAERLADEILSLPLYPGMPAELTERTADAVLTHAKGASTWS